MGNFASSKELESSVRDSPPWVHLCLLEDQRLFLISSHDTSFVDVCLDELTAALVKWKHSWSFLAALIVLYRSEGLLSLLKSQREKNWEGKSQTGRYPFPDPVSCWVFSIVLSSWTHLVWCNKRILTVLNSKGTVKQRYVGKKSNTLGYSSTKRGGSWGLDVEPVSPVACLQESQLTTLSSQL